MIKKVRIYMPVNIIGVLLTSGLLFAISQEVLMVADFNTGERFNNIGGEFGTWQIDPEDESQDCKMELNETISASGNRGYFLRLDYDVDSPKPAFNGFWMKLNNLNLTPYEYLSFLVKGEGLFTTQFKVELKNAKGEKVIYFVSGVTNSWQKVVITLDKLKKVNSITDWTQMTEFLITFDDIVATEKIGVILIDNISFTKFKEEEPEEGSNEK